MHIAQPWPQQISAKNRGTAVPFRTVELSPRPTCGQGRRLYQVVSSSIQPFGHIRHGTKIGGWAPFVGGGGAGSPSNTMSPGPRPTSIPSGLLIHPAIWPQRTWAENWGELCPLFAGAGSHLAQCGLDRGPPPRQVPSWSIQPFGHNRHGPKIGWLHPIFGKGELGPHITQSHGLRPTSIPSCILIHPAIWLQQIWTENWWGLWPGPKPTCMPSFIFIRPIVWPQYTNVRDRQDRQRSD